MFGNRGAICNRFKSASLQQGTTPGHLVQKESCTHCLIFLKLCAKVKGFRCKAQAVPAQALSANFAAHNNVVRWQQRCHRLPLWRTVTNFFQSRYCFLKASDGSNFLHCLRQVLSGDRVMLPAGPDNAHRPKKTPPIVAPKSFLTLPFL